jgi:hypothetical protein
MRYDIKSEEEEGGWRFIKVTGPGKLKQIGRTNVVEMNGITIDVGGPIISIKEVDEERQQQVNRILDQIPEHETDAILPMLIKQLQDRKKQRSIAEEIDDEDEDIG